MQVVAAALAASLVVSAAMGVAAGALRRRNIRVPAAVVFPSLQILLLLASVQPMLTACVIVLVAGKCARTQDVTGAASSPPEQSAIRELVAKYYTRHQSGTTTPCNTTSALIRLADSRRAGGGTRQDCEGAAWMSSMAASSRSLAQGCTDAECGGVLVHGARGDEAPDGPLAKGNHGREVAGPSPRKPSPRPPVGIARPIPATCAPWTDDLLDPGPEGSLGAGRNRARRSSRSTDRSGSTLIRPCSAAPPMCQLRERARSGHPSGPM
mmetsp:Transcript_4493/g.13126  ORF Transcript_4493/g.13126 Transcript_4493/m.13126 type:complete len:267 (+) Transcript_4493:383-1183(+)